MKRLLLIGLSLLSFTAVQAQSDPGLTAFGNQFIRGLAEGNRKGLDPLWISEADALPTLQAAGMDEEQQRQELEGFHTALPRMETNYNQAYDQLKEALKGKKLDKAVLVEVRREKPLVAPLEPGRVDKSDLLIIFNVKDEQFVIDVDDCVKTINGWRFTAKFHLDSLDN